MRTVTVGLITYNRKDLLKRAVKSVIRQKYNKFQLLIGNDFEKEKITFKKLGIKKDPRIKIFNHKKNLGERNNMNFLLNKANTKWFTWLADDDYLHRNYLQRLVVSINKNKNKNVVACYSNYSRVDLLKKIPKKKELTMRKSEFLNKFTKKEARLVGVFGLLKTNYLKKIKGIHKTGKSFLINKKKVHIYPYCDPLVPIMLSKYGNIIWIDEKLYHLNTKNNSISVRTSDYNIYKSAESYVLFQLKNTLKKNVNNINKKKILKNLIDWFLWNRLNLIKKRNPFLNLILIFYYYFDFFVLLRNKHYNSNILSILNYKVKLFTFIIKSFYRE